MAPQPPPAAFGVDGGLPAWKPNPSSSDPTFDKGFLKAAFDGDLRLVKKAARVLGRGAEGCRLADKLGAVRDGNGIGLLHSAALGGSLTVCRYLVEDIRLDVNDAGPMGHVEIVELLLSKGANPDGLSNGGTALHVAAKNGHDDIVKVLLDHHADHKIALSGTDYTALVLATIVGSLKCVKILLEAGADVDGIGKETPLLIAAIAGSTDILKCLVLAGADANVTDSYGRTPIEIAAHSCRREHVEILFPVTSRIPKVRDWSVHGFIGNVKSVPPAKKTMLASAKSKAHEAFKNGNYLIAARIYKEAMKLDPCNATLRSNSSLCWIRFGNGMEALKDAQACRMMRPGWAKACYREGTALMLLKDYEKACGAFLDGLKLEPGNAEMEEGLREAMESMKISGGSRYQKPART